MIASVAFVLAAILLVTINLQTFIINLPSFHAFFGLKNLLVMALVLAGCKVIHELGHALTCKHFGGECHELGVMLLVFTPCLYCNISDAWMMRSKWKRIATSAAGIYVELLLAAACTFLWWFSQPGPLNAIFLNVMFVCSISTLLFNGNPLLRYDGYFVLADLLEIPNLRQQSQALLQQTVMRVCFGIQPNDSWIAPRRHRAALMAYGLASLVYRWLLVCGILYIAYKALEPHRLQVFAQVFAAFVIFGMLAIPGWQMAQTVADPRARRRGSWGRRILMAVAGTILLAALSYVPVSKHIAVPVVIEPADAAWIHTTVPGRLTSRVRVGQQVAEGATLAELVNLDLDRKVIGLTGERDAQQLHVEHLKRLRVGGQSGTVTNSGNQLAIAKASLAATQRELQQAIEDQSRRKIISPKAGTIFAPRNRPQEDRSERLQSWSGSPLDLNNADCFLEAGTVLCIVGDPDNLQGVAIVAQDEIERIHRGQPVFVLLDELHHHMIQSEVLEISRIELEAAPRELAAKHLVATVPESDLTPQGVFYAVRVAMPDLSPSPLLWSSGKAKIEVQPRTLGDIIYDSLCRTFRIDL